jgi:hypothetical protein
MASSTFPARILFWTSILGMRLVWETRQTGAHTTTQVGLGEQVLREDDLVTFALRAGNLIAVCIQVADDAFCGESTGGLGVGAVDEIVQDKCTLVVQAL